MAFIIEVPQMAEYKGKNVLSIPADKGYAFSFGLTKAKLILQEWDKIVAFVQSGGKDAAGAAIEEFKGNPMIVLNPDSPFPFRFGLGKAIAAIEHEKVISKFVDTNGESFN